MGMTAARLVAEMPASEIRERMALERIRQEERDKARREAERKRR